MSATASKWFYRIRTGKAFGGTFSRSYQNVKRPEMESNAVGPGGCKHCGDCYLGFWFKIVSFPGVTPGSQNLMIEVLLRKIV